MFKQEYLKHSNNTDTIKLMNKLNKKAVWLDEKYIKYKRVQ